MRNELKQKIQAIAHPNPNQPPTQALPTTTVFMVAQRTRLRAPRASTVLPAVTQPDPLPPDHYKLQTTLHSVLEAIKDNALPPTLNLDLVNDYIRNNCLRSTLGHR